MATPGPTASSNGSSGHPTLQEFMGAGRSLNLAQKIGSDYNKFGTLLLEDDDGRCTDSIVQQHQREAENINRHIFKLWLAGKGKQPVSWATLVGVLRDMGLNRIAEDVQSSKVTQPLLTGDPSNSLPLESTPIPCRSEGSLPTSSSIMETDSAEIKHPKAEKPYYDQSKQKELSRTSKPEDMPDEDTEKDKFAELSRFCEEVVIILQTVNKNEYQAVLTFMRPPSDSFAKAVIFPGPNMVVGKFAKKKVALIRTNPGPLVRKFIKDAIKEYPKARYVLGVGVCYAFDSNKFNLADVLVSDTIIDNMIVKYSSGEVEHRGQTVYVVHDLIQIFCMDEDTDCPASAGRSSTMYSGTFCSSNVLMDDKVMRDKYLRAHPRAIGGEMEGGELLKFVLDSKLEGVIIIKGVADYADGTKAKDWQFTAAMAAARYTESRLRNVPAHKLCPVSAQSSQIEVPLARRRVVEDSSAVEEPLPGYQDYESRLSREACRFLGIVLDSMNNGVDSDRYSIAEPMLKWEEKLAPLMGLRETQIHDIKCGQYRDNHVLQRREVLKIWKDKMMLGATYGNLLKMFAKAGHSDCAKKLSDLLEEKGSRTQ